MQIPIWITYSIYCRMSPHADASVKLSMLDRKPMLGHINIGLLQTVKTLFFDDTLDRRP